MCNSSNDICACISCDARVCRAQINVYLLTYLFTCIISYIPASLVNQLAMSMRRSSAVVDRSDDINRRRLSMFGPSHCQTLVDRRQCMQLTVNDNGNKPEES